MLDCKFVSQYLFQESYADRAFCQGNEAKDQPQILMGGEHVINFINKKRVTLDWWGKSCLCFSIV